MNYSAEYKPPIVLEERQGTDMDDFVGILGNKKITNIILTLREWKE